ncbi:restriction endonuclease subunit S [Methanolobus zinderi]|uniref:Restriction endonuclease subunit S n=1 Tax=Methanolobus zinderi TaxID=536044 RepID=A0A7D5IQ13_9EURY|nr:restriction endonuclease subunit S [Methanolobus zinderi]QLC50207.1 restriction endonuclease subunit S [Methanolobus zinderi]
MKNELPEGWEWKKLGDIAEIKKGSTITKNTIVEGNVPVIAGGRAPAYFHNEANRDGETITVSASGAYAGFVNYFNNPIFASDCSTIKPKESENLSAKFLYWNLRAHQNQIYALQKGGGQPHVYPKDLRTLNLPISTPQIQHKIVSILEKAEETKKLRAQADELTQQLLQSVFLEMFGNPDENWLVTTVEEIVHPNKGSIRTGPFGSQLLHSEFVEEGIAVLGIDNAVKNEFEWSKRRYINESKYQELKRYTVHPGDVIITIMGTCGRCAIVPDDTPLAINTKHLCCITLNQEMCLPPYLHGYFLQHPVSKQYLLSKANGAIMDGLNMKIIKEMPIIIPPLNLQRKYAAIIQKINKTKQHQSYSSTELETLFNALMQKAFKGELIA